MSLQSASLSWYAIRTRSRQEERAVDNLNAWGVETLFPRFSSWSRSAPPLFPGYIFARFDHNAMLHKVRFTRGILHVVNFGGTPAPITEEIILGILCRIDEKGFIRETSALKPGDEVVIQSGPLQNLVGTFEGKLSGRERVRILLNAIAYSVHVEMPWVNVKRKVDC